MYIRCAAADYTSLLVCCKVSCDTRLRPRVDLARCVMHVMLLQCHKMWFANALSTCRGKVQYASINGWLRPTLLYNVGYYTVRHKNTPNLFTITRRRLSNFNNFWYTYSRHSLPSNDRSVSYLTQHLPLHYLVKTEQTNMH